MKFKPKFSLATVKSVAKTGVKFVEKNAPVIAAGAAVAGIVAAVFGAIKAAPEVKEALEQAELKKNERCISDAAEGKDSVPYEKLTWKEKTPIYVRGYWKVALITVTAILCVVGGTIASHHQIKTIAIMAAAAESNLADFEGAARTVLGDKKVEQIKGQIVDDKLDKKVITDELICKTGNGDTLCYEPWYGTLFYSSIPAVQAAAVRYEETYIHSFQATMDEYYRELGIPESQIPELAEKQGHFRDDEENIEWKPDMTPMSKIVKLNGVDTTVYIMRANRPRTYDDLLNEATASRAFRNW